MTKATAIDWTDSPEKILSWVNWKEHFSKIITEWRSLPIVEPPYEFRTIDTPDGKRIEIRMGTQWKRLLYRNMDNITVEAYPGVSPENRLVRLLYSDRPGCLLNSTDG